MKQFIINKAKELGIDCIGFTTPDIVFSNSKHFASNEMLMDIESFFADTKTIIAVALSYNTNITDQNANIPQYTVYNYYKILSKALNKLGKSIKDEHKVQTQYTDFYRVAVNSKLNDKLIAYSAGLGYIAHNSLITINNFGSRIILGELLINHEINDINPQIIANNCRSCDICSKNCPTYALNNGIIDKSRCIQHLSSTLDFNLAITKDWGDRFFGCSACVDCCPVNKDLAIKNMDNYKNPQYGYIGSFFDIENIFVFKKGDYKKYFKSNQLSAGWFAEVIHPRNILLAFYNAARYEDIIKYKITIKDYNWSADEEQYLLKFIDSLL